MTGILLIAVSIAWLWTVVGVTNWATRLIERNWLRLLTGGLLFIGLMVLPVADEIIGGIQFRALCEQSKQVSVNRDKAAGRTITLRDAKSGYVKSNDRRIPNVALSIIEREFTWRDIETNELILSYKSLNVQGGWLIRLLGISEGDAPLLIENTSCMPNILKTFQEYKFKQAN